TSQVGRSTDGSHRTGHSPAAHTVRSTASRCRVERHERGGRARRRRLMKRFELGAAALIAVCALAGCSRDKVRPCDSDGRYVGAQSVPPVRIPDDLSPPNESDALRVPPETAAVSRSPTSCLETPPPFSTS